MQSSATYRGSQLPVADYPAMSFSLYVDIAGSGDPLYVAELYKCWFYGQKSSIRLILFAKVVYYMREEGQDQLKGAKSMELLPKK